MTTSAAAPPTPPLDTIHPPSPSQREAIEAPARSLLVLAGPGAGKTFCLIERIRYLIEELGFDPARICAFTFTNKAAGEIAARLESRLGAHNAARIKRGTIHAFCSELLREHGAAVGLSTGYGIADEEYQLAALRRIEGFKRWHKHTLTRFSAHRFRGDPLMHDDAFLFEQYERFLAQRNVVDFDTLVIKAAELLERETEGKAFRSRWDVVLVDEFQDLNPVQYRVVHALARDHKHVFAVGDDEQSIYSWAGADPAVFKSFANDFNITRRIHLEDNRRCPGEVFALARTLIAGNTPIFADRVPAHTTKPCEYPVTTPGFATDDDEVTWLVDDIRHDRNEHGHGWGDVALLYRKHGIGERLEAAFINAGIPCRLAIGRALAEDPVIAYVLAALRVISSPKDDIHRDAFFSVLLPRALFDEARAKAESARHDLRRQLNHMAAQLPRGDTTGKQVRLALTRWRNLQALPQAFDTLGAIIQELLSRRVGRQRTVLDDRHDEISDPATLPDVVALSGRLAAARERGETIWIPRLGGVDVALKGMLAAAGFKNVQRGTGDGLQLRDDETSSAGIALGVFKALQLLEMAEHGDPFANFTAIDLETTGRDTSKCEIVEVAAVRVRDGQIVEKYHRLVKPRIPIEVQATDKHGYAAADVAGAPYFEQIWPELRAFCGDDVIVAHNGYEFDFRILNRMARVAGGTFDLCTYDTLPLSRDLLQTSKKLEHLAPMFGIETGRSHRALDDTVALARVMLKLDQLKRERARKTALVDSLDNLGIALALTEHATLNAEAQMLAGVSRAFSLGRYTSCLDAYEREQGDDLSIPTVDEVIEKLGGPELMLKVRAEKSADERYPQAMIRLRRLLAEIPDVSLGDQVSLFLERAMLSKQDGPDPERTRVNLLTLHSTKGLEFSRVYVVGVEDAQMPGGTTAKPATPAEVEEARRLLYVGMTRTIDRLVMTRVGMRSGKETRGHQFLDEMGIIPQAAP